MNIEGEDLGKVYGCATMFSCIQNSASIDVTIERGRFRWKHTYDYSLECNTTSCQIDIPYGISDCMLQYQHPHYYLLKDIVYSPGLVNHTGLYWICGHHARKGLPLNSTGTCTLGWLLTHADVRHTLSLSAELAHNLPRCIRSLDPLMKRSRPRSKVF